MTNFKTRFMLAASVTCLAHAYASDNNPGWKLDADGHIVLKDGNPVFVNSSGQEQTVGGDTIANLNAEAKKHRTDKEAALEKLKAFEGLDPVKAKEALEKITKIDQKKLLDAGEVDTLKKQITDQFTAQLTEKDNAIKERDGKINSMLIGGIFNNSDFVRSSVVVPPDMFEATFRNNFKVEDGKVVAYDKAGNRLLSKTRSGEYADPEEALQLLVDAHPQKDSILKADAGNGSGNGGGGGNRPGGRIVRRADFEAMAPTAKQETLAKINKGEMKLTD